jgi:hypothetical protein
MVNVSIQTDGGLSRGVLLRGRPVEVDAGHRDSLQVRIARRNLRSPSDPISRWKILFEG